MIDESIIKDLTRIEAKLKRLGKVAYATQVSEITSFIENFKAPEVDAVGRILRDSLVASLGRMAGISSLDPKNVADSLSNLVKNPLEFTDERDPNGEQTERQGQRDGQPPDGGGDAPESPDN